VQETEWTAQHKMTPRGHFVWVVYITSYTIARTMLASALRGPSKE